MTGRGSIHGDVASTSDVFAANLEVLGARDATLARRVAAASAARAHVEPSRAGPPTVRLVLDGREVSLASAYDPFREAGRLIDAHDVASSHACFVLGFGVGYHVETLCSRAHPKGVVFVFEPSLSVFRTALESRDLRTVLGDRRVHLVVALDGPAINAVLGPFVTPILLGTRVVPHLPSVESFPAEYARLREVIRDFITYAQTCLATTVSISVESRRNVMMNAAYYCFCPGIDDLEGILKGYPAVIVAAGPSLQRNIDRLARVRGRGVLIAMSTSLKPLLAKGIVPDFACFIDFAWLSRKYFTGLEGYEPITMVAD
ncbi:MAG TPA: 6-hydroxymethylpterin diphosphokinase MptE-like protein, partial [Planctomycetota bacterium]|nr:6-hydroxymethylpterin diphosphokinase MptE-like protein [Planctomycetota bacterium]